MKKLDKRFIGLNFIRSIIGFGLFFVFATIIIYPVFIKVSAFVVFTLIIPLLILIFLGIIFGWSYLVWYYYRYNLEQDTFKKEYGVIRKKYVSIPYARIQNVDIQRTLLDRLFGLSTVIIQTAGFSGVAVSEGVLPGVSKDDAFIIREELLKKINLTEGESKNTSGV